MTDSGKASNTGARGVLDLMLPLLRDKDLDALADMYAENGAHELPFAPPGAPRRIEGREKVRSYFASTLANVPLDFKEFREVAVHETSDPDILIAEYDAHGIVTTSRRAFTVRYLWILRISNGEIVLWRDYWNPLEILDLQEVSST